MSTLSVIVKPIDYKCKWWAKRFDSSTAKIISLNNVNSLENINFLKNGQDLELTVDDFVITSEARHRRKQRGYAVNLNYVASDLKLRSLSPGLNCKILIKTLATEEEWLQLKDGSGDVAACLRLAKAISMFDGKRKEQIILRMIEQDINEKTKTYLI